MVPPVSEDCQPLPRKPENLKKPIKCDIMRAFFFEWPCPNRLIPLRPFAKSAKSLELLARIRTKLRTLCEVPLKREPFAGFGKLRPQSTNPSQINSELIAGVVLLFGNVCKACA